MQCQMKAFLERVEHCKPFEAHFLQVEGLRSIFQVEHVVYHSLNHQGEPFALATYGLEWANYYAREELFKVDPLLSAFQHNFRKPCRRSALC